jgi:16S rRNA (guanine966-N2)-methyltransferase
MKMRIISGVYKGRFINVPQSKLIKPTSDRVRETLFNLLNNKIDFIRINVLEIYAGSGSLGLECLSRGAAKVTFVEKYSQISKNLLENINSLNAQSKCVVIKSDALNFSKQKSLEDFNLILADPPYNSDDIYTIADNFKINNFFMEDGRMIVERSSYTKEKDITNFKAEPFKVIGDTYLYEIFNK